MKLEAFSPRWHVDRGRVVGILLTCPTCGDLPGAIPITVPIGRTFYSEPGDLDFSRAVIESKVECSQCGHYHEVDR